MSKVEIVKSLKLLISQSENLKRQADIDRSTNNLLASCQSQGKSAGIDHAINILKPKIEYMQSEIKVKRIVILVLTGLLIIAGIVIYNQSKSINILQNYNDELLNEEVDYNSFQD